MTERFWLSDTQWAAIESLLPQLGGKPRVDDRRVISVPGRAALAHDPGRVGPRTTLFNRFDRWSERGLWQVLLAALAACPGSWRANTSTTDPRSHASGRAAGAAR